MNREGRLREWKKTLEKPDLNYNKDKGAQLFYAWQDPKRPGLIKVGKSTSTSRDPVERIWDEEYMHKPDVVFLIWTKDATRLERAMKEKFKDHLAAQTPSDEVLEIDWRTVRDAALEYEGGVTRVS